MIAKIDRLNPTRGGIDFLFQVPRPAFDLAFQLAGAILDAAEGPQHLAARIEDRGNVPSLRQRFLPGGQQGVVRFHPLRESRSALQFAPRFQT